MKILFENLKTGDIFESNDTIYMRTNNSVDYYDNAIALYGVRRGVLFRFLHDDEVEYDEVEPVEEY